MTPQEKAVELFKKFNEYADSNYGATKFERKWYGNTLAGERKVRKESAKKCALITVDEILKEYPSQCPPDSYEMERHLYWTEVKKEIEKL
jgi:hypothetical protein